MRVGQVGGMAMSVRVAQYLPDATSKLGPRADHDFVDVYTLRSFHQLVKQLGGDPHKLLLQARIDPTLLGKPNSVIEYTSLVRVIEYAAGELSCPDFGLRLAAMQGNTTTFSPVGVVMKNSRTLGQAISYGAKFVQAGTLPVRVRVEADRDHHQIFVWVDIPHADISDKHQAIEHTLMLASLNILEISGGAARARKILFSHAPQSPLKTYRTYFRCEVLFDQKANGVVVTENDFQCPVVDPDARVYEMATSFIEARYSEAETPLPERVRGLVRLCLDSKDCTSDRIAADLYMHRRTLQRRLRVEGTSFESIKDEVRRDVALRYVREEGVSLKRLAEILGYAETSVLTRSFSRWFSVTPTQLRAQLKSDTPSVSSMWGSRHGRTVVARVAPRGTSANSGGKD
jgi:AraC-like DNA-binding protein